MFTILLIFGQVGSLMSQSYNKSAKYYNFWTDEFYSNIIFNSNCNTMKLSEKFLNKDIYIHISKQIQLGPRYEYCY